MRIFEELYPPIKDSVKTLWFVSAKVSQESLASDARVRQVGLTYQIYRLIVSVFLLLASASLRKPQELIDPPTVIELTVVGSYVAFSLVFLMLFYFFPKQARSQLFFGFMFDIVALSIYNAYSPISYLQIAILYMITVATSFMLLPLSRAVPVMIFCLSAISYQKIFANHDNALNSHDYFLLSFCLVAVGFLSWSISQRLSAAEIAIIRHTQELEKLNLLNRTVVRNMVNGVLVINTDRNIIMLNKSAENLLRLPFDAEKCDSPATLTEVARYLAKEHPELLLWYRTIDPEIPATFTYQLKPDHNSLSDRLRINNKPLYSHGQLLIIEDINREQSQAQMLKLASLGELSASIAHEIRNPLGAISQASQLLLEMADEDDDNREFYDIIYNQTKRVNNIIADVLSLSRQETPNQKLIELSAWFGKFLNQHYPDELIELIAPTPLNVYFDPNHLEQIMVNLVNNALRHTIHLFGGADVTINLSLNGEAVFVDVIDNGEGVPESDIPMLFNPFFTTSKKGTGLGLYLSQSFSEANNAKIRYLRINEQSYFRLIILHHHNQLQK